MNMKLLGTSLLAVSCGFAITIVSCNSDKDGIADAPSQPTRGQGTVHVLSDNCNSTIGVDRCGSGTATTSYDQFTSIFSVSNSNDLQSGVKSTFADAHSGKVEISSRAPASPGEQFSTVAYNGDIEQGRVDISQDAADPTQSVLNPTFNAGDGKYRVEVYNDGQKVAVQESVPKGSTAKVAYRRIIRTVLWLVLDILEDIFDGQQQKGAHVNGGTVDAGACAWVLGGANEEAVNVTLPNGVAVQGDEIRFIEEVDGSGRYPYHSVNRLDVLSNMGSFDILSEQMGS